MLYIAKLIQPARPSTVVLPLEKMYHFSYIFYMSISVLSIFVDNIETYLFFSSQMGPTNYRCGKNGPWTDSYLVQFSLCERDTIIHTTTFFVTDYIADI